MMKFGTLDYFNFGEITTNEQIQNEIIRDC